MHRLDRHQVAAFGDQCELTGWAGVRGRLAEFVANRYSSYDSGIGAKIEAREVGLADLETYTHENGEPTVPSGRQEFLENLINEFV